MNGFGTFLAAVAGPIAKRVLTALGFGLVSYAAMSAALAQVLDAAKSAFGGMSGEVLAIVQIAGLGTAASIIAGAMTARVALMQLKRLQLIA